MRETVEYWRTKYDWRAVEARINKLPQFKTAVRLDGFDPVELHFVHAKEPSGKGLPVLFLHGWPSSFMEFEAVVPRLVEAGFDVVVPSLPGYGFSSYPRQPGLSIPKIAEIMDKAMARLGYESYLVQGGDWGALIGRAIATQYSPRVKALHLNMAFTRKLLAIGPDHEGLTSVDRARISRRMESQAKGSAYQFLHATKPRTIGYALHDSPVGMLAWMSDKVLHWSDTVNKTWRPEELITWTLMHYFRGPTTAMLMYRENNLRAKHDLNADLYVKVPVGISEFEHDPYHAPRAVAEEDYNIVFWREHEKGGHFPAYEVPEHFAADVVDYFSTFSGQ